MTHGPQYIFYICYSTIYYHVMALDVTLGYPKTVCSQDFRVYRHVLIRRLAPIAISENRLKFAAMRIVRCRVGK